MARGRRFIAALGSCLALMGPFLAWPLEVQARQPELIPRDVLFGNAEIISLDLSPDGKQLVYLAPHQGVMNLWLRDLNGRRPPRLLTNQLDRPQWGASWTKDGRYLLSARDNQGDENTVVTRIDPASGAITELTPSRGVKAAVVAMSRDAPQELVVAMNERDPRFFDLYVLNVDSGERRLLYRAEDGHSVDVQWLDGGWQVTMRKRMLPDGGSAFDLRRPGSDAWHPFLTLSFEDESSGAGLSGFSRDGRWLYAKLSEGEDMPRLVRWSKDQLPDCTAACPSELIHRSSSGVLAGGLSDLETLEPVVLTEIALRSKRIVLRPDFDQDLAGLKALAGDREFNVIDRTRDDQLWLVVLSSDHAGPEYWLWDRKDQNGRKLFSVQPSLDRYELAPMESWTFKARDGLPLYAYLTRTTLEASGPQPLVLLVHGGPRARDYWGLDPMHQLLANRGYHVLSVNYRGSTGFGKAHLNAGNGEWYAGMQDDLVDAVRWAIDLGIADPNRVAIMGASYGGYAALAGLTRDPQFFAAAVAQVGPSNVRTLLETLPPYWEAGRANLERSIGVGEVDLDAISPLSHVDRIERPLLLGHGANDPRVKLQESEAIAAAMEERGLDVDFVVFPDEGHGIDQPGNALAMNALVEAFLKQHLGGRAEPLGNVLENSSMEWRLRSLPEP